VKSTLHLGWVLLAASASLAGQTDVAPDVLKPFKAHYDAQWKSINVGTSDIELKHGDEPAQFVYVWTITARGVFKVVYSDPVTQTSWFSLADGHIRPHKYLGTQGGASVSLDFDWTRKRITGESEKKPVDIPILNGAQDLNSIQVEVMLDLQKDDLPKTFNIIDKDQLKDFNYTREGNARIRTAVGELDTVVVASQRTGNSRILRMWFAPSLGYMPVQAERWRDGKLEFAIRIKSYAR
jgi:hypothetical protein